MLECKICGKNLYRDITFKNIFKINYLIHEKCINNLHFNYNEEIIPIESNVIIYDYVFDDLKDDYNEEYLWCKYFGRVVEKHLHNKEWSMVIIHDKSIQIFIENINPYLLLNLTSNPILLISLKEKNTSYLEGL